MSYEQALAAKAMEDNGVSPRSVEVWLATDRLIEDERVLACRMACAEAFLPREDRQQPMVFIGGETGTGKTVAATVGLGSALAEGFRRQRAGVIDMARARSHLQREEVITPQRVRSALGMDWETFQANERIQPGVCAAQVRAAFAAEQPWDFDVCPVSFAFWEATERARRQNFGKEAEAAIEHARSCDILVLDDLGAETVSDKSPWVSIVNEIVNARYAHSLVTVLTTNKSLAEFTARYGARVMDRFREAGLFKLTAGTSRRGGK